MTEVSFLRTLAERLPDIGDDCAVVEIGATQVLLKVDMLIEDVHFRPGERTAADVGYRALARPLSDIAAMGGRPQFALVSLAVAPWTTEAWLTGFYDGLLALASRHNIRVVGGDLSHTSKLIADVFLVGQATRPLRRSTAQPGDLLYVTGPLGKQKWRFSPRLALGQRLARDPQVTACMDLSDGLALDLHRLAFASSLEARLTHVPVQKGAHLARALHYGEDYELLIARTGPWPNPPQGVIPIGRLVKGKQPGRVLLTGTRVPPVGYDHLKQT
jgi:thiamine-monophosphate kinase